MRLILILFLLLPCFLVGQNCPQSIERVIDQNCLPFQQRFEAQDTAPFYYFLEFDGPIICAQSLYGRNTSTMSPIEASGCLFNIDTAGAGPYISWYNRLNAGKWVRSNDTLYDVLNPLEWLKVSASPYDCDSAENASCHVDGYLNPDWKGCIDGVNYTGNVKQLLEDLRECAHMHFLGGLGGPPLCDLSTYDVDTLNAELEAGHSGYCTHFDHYYRASVAYRLSQLGISYHTYALSCNWHVVSLIGVSEFPGDTSYYFCDPMYNLRLDFQGQDVDYFQAMFLNIIAPGSVTMHQGQGHSINYSADSCLYYLPFHWDSHSKIKETDSAFFVIDNSKPRSIIATLDYFDADVHAGTDPIYAQMQNSGYLWFPAYTDSLSFYQYYFRNINISHGGDEWPTGPQLQTRWLSILMGVDSVITGRSGLLDVNENEIPTYYDLEFNEVERLQPDTRYLKR